MKKGFIKLLSLGLVVGMLSGCGSVGEDLNLGNDTESKSIVSNNFNANNLNEAENSITEEEAQKVTENKEEIQSQSSASSDLDKGTIVTPTPAEDIQVQSNGVGTFDLSQVPAWDNKTPYVIVNNNVPYFDDDIKKSTEAFENYSDLDSLGRCGVAFANICQELMPTEERGDIGSIKPSGWQTIKYDNISGKYLYNRCHLIGFQLAGENANEKNLITGTRFLNIEGMLPFEDEVADYVRNTGNHVLYRVTPIFEGNNLVASGVLMEGYSVEDSGSGVQFCMYCYNAQPNISINYADGSSTPIGSDKVIDTDETTKEDESMTTVTDPTVQQDASGYMQTFIVNTNTGKFHIPSCQYVSMMSESNKLEIESTVADLESQGYDACSKCIG